MGDRLLIVNPGSSSLKLAVLGPDDEILAAEAAPAPDARVDEVLAGFIDDARGVGAAGVRVVHGGATFRGPVVVDDEAEEALAGLDELAPLHNPQARAIISALRRTLGDVPVVACFDTAFHRTLPDAAAVYAVPWSWTHDLGVRRYGFHGLSHR